MISRRKNMDATAAQSLRKAGRRWKWLLFIRLTSGVVISCALLLVLLGGLILHGWIASKVTAVCLCVMIVLGGFGAFVVALIIALIRDPSRSWLADRIERKAPKLMDRLNTLVFLDGRPRDPVTEDYFQGIGAQTGTALESSRSLKPISPWASRFALLAAIGACFGTYHFYREFRPWDQFREKSAVDEAAANTEELDLPEDGASEMRETWGEVRITEPGGDLKLTKVDVLPLTVEAASSQRLEKAAWATSVNGARQIDRPLPKPEEPNYAVYQPTLYLDELGLSDWDVMSYYASAATDAAGHYTSEIYFVEVRPFREDIMKLESGGGNGGAQSLAELSQLIQKQQDILRQTHRQDQQAAANDIQRKQDQGKLGDAQADLKAATGHLYARIAEKMENQGVGTVLDQLALAEGTMDKAVAKLREPDNTLAQGHEQAALQQLIASRKDLVKTMSDGDGQGSGSGDAGDHTPVAGRKKPPQDQIADIEDFRDAGKAALAAVRDARAKQAKIAKETADASWDELPKLLEKQKSNSKTLQDFVKKNPAPFEGMEKDTASAAEAMSQAEQALSQGVFTGMATEKATKALSGLERQLDERLSRHSLGDVYRLKDMMDSQGRQLEKMASQPQKSSEGEMAKMGEEMKAAKDAMAETLARTPAGQSFGPQLGQALNGAPGRQLDQAAQKMQGGTEQAGQGAAEAGQSLQQIAKAFEASQPSALKGAPGSGLARGEGSGMGDGTRMLNSLIQRMEDGREPSPEDVKKQLEEARLALLEEEKTRPAASAQLAAVTRELKNMSGEVDLHVNADALRKLVDKLETVRLEMADGDREKPLDPKLLKTDPSKAPSEFRERVRRYFEKLSDG